MEQRSLILYFDHSQLAEIKGNRQNTASPSRKSGADSSGGAKRPRILLFGTVSFTQHQLLITIKQLSYAFFEVLTWRLLFACTLLRLSECFVIVYE